MKNAIYCNMMDVEDTKSSERQTNTFYLWYIEKLNKECNVVKGEDLDHPWIQNSESRSTDKELNQREK